MTHPSNEKDYAEVSILIACRNEESNIERCVREVYAAVAGAEIVVIDGGNDGTAEIVAGLQKEILRLVYIRHENDRGKGHAIQTGIEQGRGSVQAQFDADMQFMATDLPALIEPVLTDQTDFAFGSRFRGSADRSQYKALFFRDMGNWMLSMIISTLALRRVTDVTAGVKCWKKDAIQAIHLSDDKYSYEAEIVVKSVKHGYRICEVPVSYASRVAGESMHRTNLDVMRAGSVIILKSIGYRWGLLR